MQDLKIAKSKPIFFSFVRLDYLQAPTEFLVSSLVGPTKFDLVSTPVGPTKFDLVSTLVEPTKFELVSIF